MTRSKKKHPDQLRLSQDPDVLAREEDKRIIRGVKHYHVAAWCGKQGIDPPSARHWGNVVEVLTFLRHCEWAGGGNPTAQQIAVGCSRRGRRMSQRTAERSLRWATRLGVLFRAGQGRSAAERTILYARLREMIAASARVPARHSARRTEMASELKWRVEGGDVAGRAAQNGGAILYPDPLPNQPTTSSAATDQDAWAAVADEVFRAGVNQAAAAVEAARQRGATPEDVRAIVTYWRRHRGGWAEHAEAALCRRLQRYEPDLAADDGWPPFGEAYRHELAAACRRAAAGDAGREQLQRRAAALAARARLAAERARDGVTLAGLAATMAPELAAGIQRELRRAAAADAAHRPRPP